jgi:hypothetical protein
MASKIRKNTTTITVLLSLTAVSCSLPFFSRNSGSVGGLTSVEKATPIQAKLSGVIELSEGCAAGYYQIKLVGLFEGANTQVESQSDQSGHFSLVAPPGAYMVQVGKDGCGSKQAITLEENTEHMISLSVRETKAVEKAGESQGRLPASVLIEAHR